MSQDPDSLESVKTYIKQHREIIKPMFGLMFWQLAAAEEHLSAEDFAAQGMNLTLDGADDEVLANFMAQYVKIWLSANDFNAASRFVASCLEMSADELLQTRLLHLQQVRSSS